MAQRRSAEFWKSLREAKMAVREAEQAAALRRDEFNQREQLVPDWIYEPTQTTNRARPRTREAKGWIDEGVIQVTFRDGDVYNYYDVSRDEMRRFTKVKSPGRFINRILNEHPYGRA